MPLDILLTLGIIGAVLVVLWATSLPVEMVLVAGVTALLVSGALTVDEALRGFSNEGVATIAVLFVVVGGLAQSGLVNWVAHRLLNRPAALWAAQLRLFGVAGALSTTVNNTPIVAMFVPVAQQWSLRYGLPLSRLLLPMNNVVILGGMCTLVGTSTNLAVNGLLAEARPGSELHLFELAWVGAPLLLVGIVYSVLASRYLIPDRSAPIEQLENAREYSVQIEVSAGGPIVGRTIAEVGLRNLRSAYVLEIQRGERLLTAVGPDEALHAGDLLTCVGVVDAVKDLRQFPGLSIVADQPFKLDLQNWQRQLVELVLSRRSPVVGQTVRESNFRSTYRAAILSISREGRRIQGKLGDVVLEPGDTLLVEAAQGFVETQRQNRDFLLVSPVSDSGLPNFGKAPVAGAIFLAMLVAAGIGVMPLLLAALLASGAMIATGCVRPREALRSVDFPLLVAIAASFALGAALTTTGAASLLAGMVADLTANDPLRSLIVIYIATVIITELVTNNAAGVLMFPVAIAVAEASGASVVPFVVAVMVSASAGFITPLGYQTNLMVYGAGGYRFSDFVRFGLPLSALTALVALTLIPQIWTFSP